MNLLTPRNAAIDMLATAMGLPVLPEQSKDRPAGTHLTVSSGLERPKIIDSDTRELYLRLRVRIYAPSEDRGLDLAAQVITLLEGKGYVTDASITPSGRGLEMSGAGIRDYGTEFDRSGAALVRYDIDFLGREEHDAPQLQID